LALHSTILALVIDSIIKLAGWAHTERWTYPVTFANLAVNSLINTGCALEAALWTTCGCIILIELNWATTLLSNNSISLASQTVGEGTNASAANEGAKIAVLASRLKIS